MIDRIRQIGQIDRVFGAQIAACHTVATAGAGPLRHIGRINLRAEADGQIRTGGTKAKLAGRMLQSAQFWQWRGVRPGGGAQHAGRAHKTFLQGIILTDFIRPYRIIKNPRLWLQTDIGIDQRGAAQATACQHMHVLAQPEIKQRRFRTGMQLALGNLKLGLERGQPLRKIARQKFLAPFKNTDRLATARKPRGGHPAAIARTYDNDVIMQTQLINGPCQPPHAPVPTSSHCFRSHQETA